MSSFRSPGVDNVELDVSLYARGTATSVAGMVGVTTKGPIGVPTLVTSWPQFQETFGSYRTDSDLPLSAKMFFDEGGTTLYVVRTAHYTDITSPVSDAVAASIGLMDEAGTPALSLTVEALSPGLWGNDLKVAVANVVGTTFDLIVYDADDVQLERHVGLSTADPQSREYVENRINGGNSFFITVTHVQGTPDVAAAAALTGGDDGLTGLADTDFIGDAGARNGMNAFATVPTIKLISIPGINSETVHQAMLAYAELDGTVFAVLGAPQGLDAQAVIAHRQNLSGGYGALYWPWPKTRDPQTSQVVTVPPDGFVLGTYARNDQIAVWSAPAGFDRARLRGALGVEYDSTRAERDELYEAQVNAIAYFPGQGTVVWGQKTLTSKPSALDRVNVRRMLNYIKEVTADTSQYLLFEPNDARTWAAFVRYMEPFLQNIKEGRGLYDYRVVCDETTNTNYYMDRNQMVASIFINPTRTAEGLLLQYVVTPSGTDFSEI